MASLDFDEEAHKLFAKLGLDAAGQSEKGFRRMYNPMDPIFRHGKTTIYVGNQQAAQNAQLMQREGITHIVNCTNNMPFYHPNAFKTYRFDISFAPMDGSDDELGAFIKPMLEFVENAFQEQGNVLVHCLAGAHRAGTTGTMLLMHLAELPDAEAISTAKRLRPVIDPIGRFPHLLRRYNALRPKQAKIKVEPASK